MMPGMGAKKFTTGSMTLVLNQPETADQMPWMVAQRFLKNPAMAEAAFFTKPTMALATELTKLRKPSHFV